MCGIGFAPDRRSALAMASAMSHRGPDASGVEEVEGGWLVHTRLAIVDPNPRSNMPMRRGDATVVWNGEAWNHLRLREIVSEEFTTTGDSETVTWLMDGFGHSALEMIDGMFGVIWTAGQGVYASRDRFGEVPLHLCRRTGMAASELKALVEAGASPLDCFLAEPGVVYRLGDGGAREVLSHHESVLPERSADSLEEAAPKVRRFLERSVDKRQLSDVPVCSLLSGGLDSTAISALVSAHRPDLVAYTAVFDDNSLDLRHAREAAEALSIDLVEVSVPLPTAEDLSRTVSVIEMPFKAQVEIAWPCLYLAEAMSSDGFRVTFSGEGSDELWGSYGFAYHGIKEHGFREYRRRLFHDQHRKNFPRANKAFLAHGVECRLPFLDPQLVPYALSLDEAAVRRGSGGSWNKAVLAEAVRDLVPEAIASRPKVAFQDGMGIKRAIAESRRGRGSYVAEFERYYGNVHQRRLL